MKNTDLSIEPTNSLHLEGWMRTELNLTGNELLVFAIIYSFTQDGKTWFRGDLHYAADWVGVTLRTILSILDKLAADNLILKRSYSTSNGRTETIYAVNSRLIKSLAFGGKRGNYQKRFESEQTEDQTTDTETTSTNQQETKTSKTPKGKPYGEFKNVILTDEQLEQLKDECPNDWQERIEAVSSWCESKGKTYHNYFAALKKWRMNSSDWDNKKPKSNPYNRKLEF